MKHIKEILKERKKEITRLYLINKKQWNLKKSI